MNAVDASEHFEKPNKEQNPSRLVIILDTNPAAWALLSDTLPLSTTVANLLVLVNAHLACNYTNKVAVIASHCDKAQYLYPTLQDTKPPFQHHDRDKRKSDGIEDADQTTDRLTEPTKRLKLNGPKSDSAIESPLSSSDSNKYRPFRLIESELLSNLTSLLLTTTPSTISNSTTSTKIAGALTLALSYINRESLVYNQTLTGTNNTSAQSNTLPTSDSTNASTNRLQSHILLLSVSPSADLAHQYIPIMNSIFACQRLSIPIDILQLPLPNSPADSTVFLQQAADATHGIFIPARLTTTPTTSSSSSTTNTTISSNSQSLLTYLLTSFLPSPSTRAHLILPTRIDVDFRAACFCHRNIVSTGFVCSICLSIFCAPPEDGECLTCGSQLVVGDYGKRPVVVRRRKGKRRRDGAEG